MGDESLGHETWSIRANASLHDAYSSPGCPAPIRHALSGAFTWQNRNRTLVQRALVSASIAPQWTAALLALGATVTLEEDAGSLEVALEDLLERRAKGTPLTVSVRLAGIRWGEARIGRTRADVPIVSAVAAVEERHGIVHRARLALTGVWPRPVRLAKAAENLVGKALDEDRIASVAGAVSHEVEPIGDFRGSVEYRTAMAEVLSRRALMQCLTHVSQEVQDE